MKLHGKRHSVDKDENEDNILKRLGSDQPPDFILKSIFWNVATNRLCL